MSTGGKGRPATAGSYQKGQCGNPRGRPRKMPATVATMVEKAVREPIVIENGQRQLPSLEVILVQLMHKIAQGNLKAYKVLGKYEDFAKTKPRPPRKLSPKQAARLYEQLGLGPYAGAATSGAGAPETDEERQQRRVAERVERMLTGLEPASITRDMTQEQAAAVYEHGRKNPWPAPRRRIRPRKGPLEAGEIFEQTVFGPVTTHTGGKKVTASRIERAIRVLVAEAVRGDIASADTLIEMHATSKKKGDFGLS